MLVQPADYRGIKSGKLKEYIKNTLDSYSSLLLAKQEEIYYTSANSQLNNTTSSTKY